LRDAHGLGTGERRVVTVPRSDDPADGVRFFTLVGGKAARRYFRVHTGRTWRDCRTPDVDRIYHCQKFGAHDRFFLYACKGRLFFKVGEFDKHQWTLLYEGIGGCGKSTVMMLTQKFWPPHLRGILSSNVQPQFGMSSVALAKVVFCNEVSGDLQIVQEEWQTSVSGEWGSYAVKHKEPLIVKWEGQHFWVGNSFPKRFRNEQGQVSRRLAGVLMSHAVSPRDGNVLQKMVADMGYLQRKEILAYFEMTRQTGNTDPMSVPHTLPPAFEEYYRMGRRKTDPMEDFLACGEFVAVAPASLLLMSDFRSLYNQYRQKYDLGRSTKWSEELYRTPFNERGLSVVRRESVTIGAATHANADVVVGLQALVVVAV
jgi:hypothetical protein